MREDRMKLIDLVLKKGKTIKYAAKKLRISPSTARVIIRKYENSGEFFEPKAVRQERQKIDECPKEPLQDQKPPETHSMFVYWAPYPCLGFYPSWVAPAGLASSTPSA